MKVTIMYRNSYVGGDGWTYYPMTIDIADTCPVCGGPRGKPYGHNFVEDGVGIHVDRWDNPCGHIDKYADVYREFLSSVAPPDNPMPRKPKAWVRKNTDGSHSVCFEDVDDGQRKVGKFATHAKAMSFAEMNGYAVMAIQLHDRCGCSNG